MAQTLGTGRRPGRPTNAERAARGVDGKGADTQPAQPAKFESNARARKEIISEVVRDLMGIDAKLAKLHEDRREVLQKRIKADLNMNLADFNRAYTLYLKDSEERTTALDVLHEVFSTLAVGGQLDWISVAAHPEANANVGEHNAEHDLGLARTEGYHAGEKGLSAGAHPYQAPNQDKLRAAWEEGWQNAQADAAHKLGGEAKTDESASVGPEQREQVY